MYKKSVSYYEAPLLSEKITAATLQKRKNTAEKYKAILQMKRKIASRVKPTRDVAMKRAKRSAREQIRKKRLGDAYKSGGLAMTQRAMTLTGSTKSQALIKRIANKLLPQKLHKHII